MPNWPYSNYTSFPMQKCSHPISIDGCSIRSKVKRKMKIQPITGVIQFECLSLLRKKLNNIIYREMLKFRFVIDHSVDFPRENELKIWWKEKCKLFTCNEFHCGFGRQLICIWIKSNDTRIRKKKLGKSRKNLVRKRKVLDEISTNR